MTLRIVLIDDDASVAGLLRANFELDNRFELVGPRSVDSREGSTAP